MLALQGLFVLFVSIAGLSICVYFEKIGGFNNEEKNI